MLNDLIINKLKEITKLQDIINIDDLYYKSKRRKIDSFAEYSLPFYILRDIHEGYLSLKGANEKQNRFSDKLKTIDKSTNSVGKNFFLSNIR